MALQKLKRPKKRRGYKQHIEAECKEETTEAQELESAAVQQEPVTTETDDAAPSTEVEPEPTPASPDAAPSNTIAEVELPKEEPDPREAELSELLEKLKSQNNDWRLETALRLRHRKNIPIEALIHAAKLLLVDDWRYRLAAKDTLFSYTSPFSPGGELCYPDRYGKNKEEEAIL